jgi:hypothetical protein
MGKIPASYYLRKAMNAEDIVKSFEYFGYFQKQMLTSSFFILKEYDDALKKYFKKLYRPQ